jgi:hypothetical protein
MRSPRCVRLPNFFHFLLGSSQNFLRTLWAPCCLYPPSKLFRLLCVPCHIWENYEIILLSVCVSREYYCWPSTAQSFLAPCPAGLMAIFYYLMAARVVQLLYVYFPNFFVFYAVRVVSKKGRRLVLLRTSCFLCDCIPTWSVASNRVKALRCLVHPQASGWIGPNSSCCQVNLVTRD